MQYKISFQQMDYFLTVADSLSFTAASRILFVSQPALSKQIGVLEKELGFPLFIRDKRHVALTPEGAALARDWKALSEELETSIYNARTLRTRAAGNLKIGCSDTFDYSDVLPEMIRRFSSTYPDVHLDIMSHSFKTLRQGLAEDEFDVILTPYFELKDLGNVHWLKLKEIPLSIVIPSSNPLSSLPDLTLTDLKEEQFILISPKDSIGGNEKTQALCRQYGFNIKNIRYVPNVSSLELAVHNGLGIAICYGKPFEHNKNICRVIPIDSMPDDSFLVAIWKKGRQSISLELFVNLLQTYFPNPIN